MQTKKLLYEVSIIRPLIIFLLVVLHSFAIYDGQWAVPEGVKHIPAYFWFAKLISGFRIETIALVAGYVFAYQSNDLGRKYAFMPFVMKKLKRLISPALFFGCIYFYLFRNTSDFWSLATLMTLLSGVGHLWFLPMLFWCFIFLWAVDWWAASAKYTLPLLALLSIIPIPFALPLGFQRLPHFLFYAYGGYVLYLNREWIWQRMMNRKCVCALACCYVCLVTLQYTLLASVGGGNLQDKLITHTVTSTNKMIFSCCGIMALYLVVCSYTTKVGFKPKDWVVEASSVCYGVYVYHQFILRGLYHYTSLPNAIDSYSLPWLTFAITLITSLLLTSITLKTKIGRYLIG